MFFHRYYSCYVVGIIEKDKWSLLQYENAKYLLTITITIPIFHKS